jgi:hypothetical protein
MVAETLLKYGLLAPSFPAAKENDRAAFGFGQTFWNVEGPMKKLIFAVSVLMLAFTASAHANDVVGACCNAFLPADTVTGPSACCLSPISQSFCQAYGGQFQGANTTCDSCCPLTVSAGSNQTVCAGKEVALNGQVTGSYDGVKWTTSGDGLFANDTALSTTYTPGSGDKASGSVMLTLTAASTVMPCQLDGLVTSDGALIPCSKSSSLKVTINPVPDCTITLDPDAADGSVEAGTQHTASVPSAGAGASYQWIIQDENGNDLITSPTPYGNAVTWMAPQHAAKLWINVMVTDANGCSCTYDPPIDGKDKGIPVLVQAPVPTLSGWGMAIFALLLTGLAAAVFRKKNAGLRKPI